MKLNLCTNMVQEVFLFYDVPQFRKQATRELCGKHLPWCLDGSLASYLNCAANIPKETSIEEILAVCY
jgi:hypothetical protein